MFNCFDFVLELDVLMIEEWQGELSLQEKGENRDKCGKNVELGAWLQTWALVISHAKQRFACPFSCFAMVNFCIEFKGKYVIFYQENSAKLKGKWVLLLRSWRFLGVGLDISTLAFQGRSAISRPLPLNPPLPSTKNT